MDSSVSKPNPEIAAAVVASIVQDEIVSSTRLPTGDQNFVFAMNTVFDDRYVEDALSIAKSMKANLMTVKARPFLWDASERNVMVHEGKISGIVDVDEICFGDPLFVIGLTHVALAMEGCDSLYTETWEKLLCLDTAATHRLAFYRLFYVIVFMPKHAMNTTDKKQVVFDTDRLCSLFKQFFSKCS